MSRNDSLSIAQFADRFLQRIAGGVILLAVSSGLGAAVFLVSDELGAMLDKAQLVFAALAVVLVLPSFLRFVRVRRSGQSDYEETDSYIGQVFHKACVAGFAAAFVLLPLGGRVGREFFSHLPAEFITSAILALTLAAFGVAFFISMGRDDGEVDDEFDREQ